MNRNLGTARDGVCELSIATINIRELKGKLHFIDQLRKIVEVVIIRETWIRPRDQDLRDYVSKEVSTTQIQNGLRGFGVVAIRVSRKMNYK